MVLWLRKLDGVTVCLFGAGHYHFTESGLFKAGSHPFVRVEPRIPMTFRSHNWDVAWLVAWTDGRVRAKPLRLDLGVVVPER